MTPPDLSGPETRPDARQCPQGPAAPQRLGPEHRVGLGVSSAGSQRLPPTVAGGLSPVPLRGGPRLYPGTAARLPWLVGSVQSAWPGVWPGVWPQEGLAKASSPEQPTPHPPFETPMSPAAGWLAGPRWRALSHRRARPLPRHVPASGLQMHSPCVPLAGPSPGSPCPSRVTSSAPALTGSGSRTAFCLQPRPV